MGSLDAPLESGPMSILLTHPVWEARFRYPHLRGYNLYVLPMCSMSAPNVLQVCCQCAPGLLPMCSRSAPNVLQVCFQSALILLRYLVHPCSTSAPRLLPDWFPRGGHMCCPDVLTICLSPGGHSLWCHRGRQGINGFHVMLAARG